jgi:ParB-like chromosome segregation protein Spo0J
MPLIIRELDDEQMAIAAFEENEKRKDLNPVEKAMAIRKMIEDFGWTQQQVADKVRVDRSTVSNMIRMLRMPEDVLFKIENGILPVRSAMALLAWYELTELEKAAVRERYAGDFEEFVALARNGEVNSDTIRERLSDYLGFLTPEQISLDLAPVVVEGDSVTVTDELEVRSIEEEIKDIPDDEPEGENFVERTPAEAEEALIASEKQEEEKETKAVTPVVPTEPPAPEPASQDILFTITWGAGGVFVGLRRPGGKPPVVRYMATLTADEVPALLKEMGIE